LQVFILGRAILADKQECMANIGTIFHNLLFAYQKSLKNILNSGSEIFVDPVINLLLQIEEEEKFKLVNSKTLEEALQNFADFLVKAKVVRASSFEKMGDEKYIFRVEGCIWANHVHKMLNPKDIICPYGLVAIALYKKFTGNKVNDRESRYYSNGSETTLEPLATMTMNVFIKKVRVEESHHRL
jgi:hypothetical protein